MSCSTKEKIVSPQKKNYINSNITLDVKSIHVCMHDVLTNCKITHYIYFISFKYKRYSVVIVWYRLEMTF